MENLLKNLWNRMADRYKDENGTSYSTSIYLEAKELANRMIEKQYMLNSNSLQFFHAVMNKVDNGSYTDVVTLDDAIDMV